MADQPSTETPTRRRISVTVDCNRLETLETGSDRLDAILDLIDGAKNSLRVIFYIFAGDEAGTAVRDALIDDEKKTPAAIAMVATAAARGR